jgi:type III pantothenate kinase
MLLVIDIGNTQTVLGVYDGETLVNDWRISTDAGKSADEYGVLLTTLLRLGGHEPDEVSGVCLSSVVPPLTGIMRKTIDRFFHVTPVVVGPGVKTGLSILYDNPREVGADRIVNAVAGYDIYGGPLIIVDFGTATTFCAVSAEGEYLGGSIAPGVRVGADALAARTAKLPKVELLRPPTVVGKDTVSSMQSGLIYGFADLVDGLICRIRDELGGRATVVGTGGLVDTISSVAKNIEHVEPHLTLKGLRIIYGRNK